MQSNNLRGIILMVLAMGGFAIEDLFLKYLSGDVPPAEILIITGFGSMFAMMIVAISLGAPVFSRKLHNRHVYIRSSADMIGSLFFIWSIVLLPLTILSAIVQAIPLFVTAGAALFLGETVGIRRWSAIFVGFIGVLIIIRPDANGLNIGALLALGMVVALTVRDLATRRMQVDLPSVTLAIYGFLGMGIAGLLMAPFGADFIKPTYDTVIWYTCAIIAATIAYYMLVISTRIGDASVVAPYRYSRLIFAMILAGIFLGEQLDKITGVGITLVIGSGLYTFWRERRLRKS